VWLLVNYTQNKAKEIKQCYDRSTFLFSFSIVLFPFVLWWVLSKEWLMPCRRVSNKNSLAFFCLKTVGGLRCTITGTTTAKEATYENSRTYPRRMRRDSKSRGRGGRSKKCGIDKRDKNESKRPGCTVKSCDNRKSESSRVSPEPSVMRSKVFSHLLTRCFKIVWEAGYFCCCK
jgi:hypothetical protein